MIPPPQTPPTNRAWLIVGLLCVVAALNYLDRNMLATMRPSLVAAIPMTNAEFGWLTTIFLLVYGLLSPFAGFLADRFSRSRIIIVSLVVWSAVTWLTAHAQTYTQLFVARALMGVSEAAYIPAALALISDYHRGPTRSLATGVHMTGVTIGSGLGGLGGWFADRYPWTYPFSLFGAIGIGYAVLLFVLLRDAPRDRSGPENASVANNVRLGEALRSLFAQRGFWVALAFFGILGIAGWGLVGWLPTYFQEHFKLSQGTGGLSATVWLSVAGFTGVLVGGALGDFWSKKNPRGRIIVPAIGLCIAAGGIMLLATAPVLPAAIAGLVVYGITRNFTDANMMPILCLVADPRYRATGYGLLNLTGCVIGGIWVYAGGALRDANIGLNVVFGVMAAILVLCAFLLSRIKPASDAPSAAP